MSLDDLFGVAGTAEHGKGAGSAYLFQVLAHKEALWWNEPLGSRNIRHRWKGLPQNFRKVSRRERTNNYLSLLKYPRKVLAHIGYLAGRKGIVRKNSRVTAFGLETMGEVGTMDPPVQGVLIFG